MQTLYNCSQQDFYNAARLGIKICGDKVADLGKLKGKYTPEFFTFLLADVNAADQMPDADNRRAMRQNVRLDLVALKNKVLKLYGFLKSYIDEAYDADRRDLMYTAAGDGYAAKARAENWGSVTTLLSSAIPFTEKNKDHLTAKNNMPPTFLDDLKAAEQAFKAGYDIFLAIEGGKVQADEKIAANNAVYTAIVSLLTDAQRVFKDEDPAFAKKLSFSALVAQTHGTKNAGLVGKITQTDGKTPIVGAIVSLAGTEKTTVTDSEGKYEFYPLSIGSYSVMVKADTYITQTVSEQNIKLGTVSRLNFQLASAVGNTLLPQGT